MKTEFVLQRKNVFYQNEIFFLQKQLVNLVFETDSLILHIKGIFGQFLLLKS